MTHSVWDTDLGKLLGAFDTEEEALAVVRTLVETYGPGEADDLTVSSEYPDGSLGESLFGAALLARLERQLTPAR